MPEHLLPSVSVPPDHPYAALNARLQPLMHVYSFSLLRHRAPWKVPPFGLELEGLLKPDRVYDGLDRAQRRHFLEAFEQLLDVFAEFGMGHLNHPEFDLAGHVVREPAGTDRLVPEARVRFRLRLEGAWT